MAEENGFDITKLIFQIMCVTVVQWSRTDSYPVATYLFSQRNMERQFDARKGAWEGGRKSDDWQITKSIWRLVFPPKARQTKKAAISPRFLVGNLPCPNETCVNSLSTHSRDGIDHHYRAIHKINIRKTRSVESGKYAFIPITCS